MAAIHSLLVDPNFDCIMGNEACALKRESSEKFIAVAKEWTKKYAM